MAKATRRVTETPWARESLWCEQSVVVFKELDAYTSIFKFLNPFDIIDLFIFCSVCKERYGCLQENNIS